MIDQKASKKKWHRGLWWKLPLLLPLVIIGLYGLNNAALNVNEYDSPKGFPECNSSNFIKEIKKRFNTIPLYEKLNVTALEIFDIEQMRFVEGVERICTATVLTSRATEVKVNYREFVKKDHRFLEVNIVDS